MSDYLRFLQEGFATVLEERARHPDGGLSWPRALRSLLTGESADGGDLRSGDRLVDFGCASGYALRAFDDLDVSYLGIDLNPAYLAVGRAVFAGDPRVYFLEHDLMDTPPPVLAEVGLCSALLETCPGLLPVLAHVAQCVTRMLVIRTHLGPAEEIHLPSPMLLYADGRPQYANQYAVADLVRVLSDLDFAVTLLPDTVSGEQPVVVRDGFKPATVRTATTVLARKRTPV